MPAKEQILSRSTVIDDELLLIIMTEINHHEQDDYFILIERVNSKGKYQKNIFCLFYFIWFITAFIILQTAFLLLPKNFECSAIADHEQCKAFVCALPQSEWEKYQAESLVNSMASEFGRYHCQYEQNISTYKMTLFVGIFFGYIVFTYFSDNFGRRLAMILTWVTANVGILIICASYRIEMACVGLFLAGAGCESNIRVNLAIINETVDYHLRQTYSLILQTAFGIAGILVAFGYYFLHDWRLVNIIFCAVPAVITLAIILNYLEQTPTHLQSKGSKAILRSLERIANINGLQCKITEYDILKVMAHKRENRNHKDGLNHKMNISDLFRYKSLKKNTIYLSIILFFLSSLYIGPSSTLDKFKQNIFLLQIILSLSDCVAYPIACYYIFDIERKKAGIKYFAFCALFTLMAHFFVAPEHCDFCFQNVMKLILLFLSRYCISYYYGIIFLYIVEIYPEQIRSIGFGTVSAMGALGSTLIQKIFGYIEYHQQDPLLYMFVFCLICLYATTKLPETHGQPLQVEIEQLKKKRLKKRYEPTLEQSYDDIQLSSGISNSRTSESSRSVRNISEELPDVGSSPQKASQNSSLPGRKIQHSDSIQQFEDDKPKKQIAQEVVSASQ